MTALSVRGISKHFGGVVANRDVSFDVGDEELVGVIGPNGAGKTTLFNQISGLMRPDAGEITLAGKGITGLRPDRVCRAGLARTFQDVRVFLDRTVLDNVVIGALLRQRKQEDARRVAMQTLERVDFDDQAHTVARELTLAGRKRLELARALATGPKVLLLDEVMSGLTQREAQQAVHLLQTLRTDVTIVMIEHVMEIIMPLSDRIVVIVNGEKLVEGSPTEISRNSQVVRAYLGEKWLADDN